MDLATAYASLDSVSLDTTLPPSPVELAAQAVLLRWKRQDAASAPHFLVAHKARYFALLPLLVRERLAQHAEQRAWSVYNATR